MEEFDRTSNIRRNQLADTQRITLEKFDKECLTKYGINMLSLFPNINQYSYFGGDNNGLVMPTSISSATSHSSITAQMLNLTTTSQNSDQSLNNLISSTTNNPSSAIQTNLTPQSSALQFVGSTNNQQKIMFTPQPQYQPGNRSSVLVTSSEYLKSQPQYINLHNQQPIINQVYNPATSVLVFADNTFNNNNNNNKPGANPSIVMREHRSTSLINQKLPINSTNQQLIQPKNSQSIPSPNTSTVVSSPVTLNSQTASTTAQQNRRNSTAFT